MAKRLQIHLVYHLLYGRRKLPSMKPKIARYQKELIDNLSSAFRLQYSLQILIKKLMENFPLEYIKLYENYLHFSKQHLEVNWLIKC